MKGRLTPAGEVLDSKGVCTPPGGVIFEFSETEQAERDTSTTSPISANERERTVSP